VLCLQDWCLTRPFRHPPQECRNFVRNTLVHSSATIPQKPASDQLDATESLETKRNVQYTLCAASRSDGYRPAQRLVDLAVGVNCRVLSDRRLAVVVLVRVARGGVRVGGPKLRNRVKSQMEVCCQRESASRSKRPSERLHGRRGQPHRRGRPLAVQQRR